MRGAEWASAQLVAAAARDGHVESLAALVANTHPHVLRFAHTLCASPQDRRGRGAGGTAQLEAGAVQQSGTVLVDRAGLVRYTKAATMPTAGYDRAAGLRTLTAPG